MLFNYNPPPYINCRTRCIRDLEDGTESTEETLSESEIFEIFFIHTSYVSTPYVTDLGILGYIMI